jgi:DNA-binding NarL/FixJ family response regulator
LLLRCFFAAIRQVERRGKAMLYQDDGLTARERELVILIARGKVVKEIAPILNVTEKTVRNHLSNVYHKLAVYDRSQVVIYALKKGLVDLQSL